MADDITEEMMTSAKTLLTQCIHFMIDNIFAKFHDVTVSSSKVIKGGFCPAPLPPRFFTFKKAQSNLS